MPTQIKPINWALLGGDLGALLLFVYVGQRDHETVSDANPLLGVLWTVLPFALTWVCAGLAFGAFRAERPINPRAFFAALINTWLVAVPLGLLLRSLILGRAAIPTLFVITGYGFIALFLLAWRLLFWWIVQSQKPKP